MVPFESIDTTSAYFCSSQTLYQRYQLEYEQLQYFRLGQIYLSPHINQRSQQHSLPSPSQLPYFIHYGNTHHFFHDL